MSGAPACARGASICARRGRRGLLPGADPEPPPTLDPDVPDRNRTGDRPMTPQDMEARIVRYGELQPCKTAFIDAHTPGSDQKENFTIIGGGVSESPRPARAYHHPARLQHRRGRPAAESAATRLHDHRTAEAFFVLSGRWRFSGVAGATRARSRWKRATSSTSPPASSGVLRISAPITG